MKNETIKNIIFDLGNVIIECPDINTIKHFSQNEQDAELLKTYIFKSLEWKMLDRGSITRSDAIKNIQKRAPKEYNDIIENIMCNWYGVQKINEKTIDIARNLKNSGYKIYVLSNMAKDTYEYYKKLDFFNLCDGIVISGYEGIVKPDKQIFLNLLERYNLKSEECLFIDDDDTSKSINAANELGILGRRVMPNDSEDVRLLLKEFGVEI